MTSTLGGGDTDRLLGKIFLGKLNAPSALGQAPVTGTVVSATDTTVTVTVDNFDPNATFTATYEPRYTPGSSSQITPPAGTSCLLVVPGNGSTPWVIAFAGWPT